MKNSKKFIVLISAVWMLILFYQNVQAQQNLAQEAYAIFEQSCLICHGENGAYRESLIIEHTALIEGGTVIPGNPEDSVFYQRLIETDIAKRMPLGQPPLAPEAIETIYQWIAAGAPDWDAIPKPKPDFITTDAMLETIENHVNSLSPRDKSFARYFTLTHLYNAGETTEALNAYRRALSKLINSLSWGRKVVKPQPIDAEQTLFYIDLRDYEWDVRNDAWTQIEQAYPYKMTFDTPLQAHLREKLTTLQQEMNCEVPFVHVDWFLATASLPPLYHDILALPETDRELEASLEVFVAKNLLNAPGKRVWRAGFNNSRVSRHNRVVERHISRYGAYWKSYDFAGSSESQNILTHPLDFSQDGGEIIFNLPNGLQAYFIVDREGIRIDAAPISIVSNPAVADPTVRTGLSCIGCHTKGMQTFEDEVRAVVEQADNPPFNKERALDLYVEKTVMDGLVEEDTQRYRNALEAAGGVFGGIEPVQRLHEAFQTPLSAAHAAAAVGLETEVFLEKISKNVSLQNLLGALVVEGGTVKRDAWTSDFHDVISGINSPDTVPPPVVERPEIIPGAGVHIPDPNLRAAIEEALGKAVGDVITVKDMESLIDFTAEKKQIGNLAGLEFAKNLDSLNISRNPISDLSPLAGLTALKTLEIHWTQLSDLSPLAKLINLQHLGAWGKDYTVSDLSPLSNLTNLKHLDISGSREITDISPLANLTDLIYLRLYDNGITDISPLSNLINLEILFVEANRTADRTVWDLLPLANLTHLRVLSLANNVNHIIISDISPLSGLGALEWLDLNKNNISDISPLAKLTNLKELNLYRNKIEDVSPLAALTQLEWLKLTHNPITDFSPLDELFENTNVIFDVTIPDPNLRAAIVEALGKEDADSDPITLQEMVTLTTLRAINKDIKDLTGLESAINLEELWIGHNPVSDLSPLAGLKNFIGLHGWETRISDLSPLSGLTKLRWLDFGRTPTDGNRNLIGSLDLTPLAGITSLKKLTFYACGIQDILPLANLTELTHLAVGGNRTISDASPVAGLINLEYLDFHHDSISDLAPLAGLTNLKFLNLYDNRLVSDLSPLAELTSLTHLDLWRNMISDVSPLEGLVNLKKLFLSENLIADIFPLEELFESTYISWLKNPGAPIEGPKIEGPWLWVLLPGKRLDSDTDWLAEASDGFVTEHEIATKGATEGKAVGNKKWAAHKISPTGRNNFQEVLRTFGVPPDQEASDNVVYGSVILSSPQEQNTKMLVGSEGRHKIWLNGDLIHQDIGLDAVGIGDYGIFFPVTLKQGANILLVAIDNKGHDGRGQWITGHFGFEEGTEYTVIPPRIIPDPNLRTVIAEALDKEDADTAPITLEEMATLTTLRARNKDIKDLTGIEYAINLENFFVSMTEAEAIESTLSDLSPLAGLTKLRRLSIPGKMISDLSPLSGLVNLAELQLFVTNVSNLSPLAGLTNLKSLLFNHAPVSDLSPIAELTGLESLRFFYAESPSREGLSPSLEPLKGLVGLKILSAARSRIKDISPLSGLVNLEELELFDNHLISDVSPLASMHKLRRLNLHRNDISDVSPLASLRSLVWVDLAFNNISDISPMEGLPEDPNVIWYENPGFPVGGPKIEGPWLWSMVPGPELDNDTDFLAQASSGAVTELQIASYGAVEGTAVGEGVWTAHNISSTGGNNISEMTNALGWTTGEETVGYILYGSVKLNSPREQQTEIFVGADDGVKVWLNGKFIHKKFGGGWDPFASNYQNNIPVTLNKGVNVLLVAIDNRWGNWSGFFGFEPETEYTVLPLGIAIPDRNLRAAFAEALSKATDDVITVEDMTKLKSLKAVDKGIQNLTGLQYATNLESLEMWDNQISDISPLKELKNLRKIWLTHNQISDLSPLTGLINLKELYLSGNPVSDLTPIKNLKNLLALRLWDCPVSDLSPLTGLTELKELTLAYDYVDIDLEFVDISPLTGLTIVKFRINDTYL